MQDMGLKPKEDATKYDHKTAIGELDTNKAAKINKGNHKVHHLAIEERGLV